jgi:acylphosphatase
MTESPLMVRPDVRQRFTVTGVVQGVGFRPFVHRIASELGLAGFVGNDSGAVFLEVQGDRARVDEFGRRLRAEAPPLARIGTITVADLAADAASGHDFRIVASRTVAGGTTPIPPDIAVCDDCVAELFDPHDRRYRHPFVTCTNCGPPVPRPADRVPRLRAVAVVPVGSRPGGRLGCRAGGHAAGAGGGRGGGHQGHRRLPPGLRRRRRRGG